MSRTFVFVEWGEALKSIVFCNGAFVFYGMERGFEEHS